MESEDWRSLSADLKPGQPYPEGWYAVAMSSEVPADRAVGRPFLDSRIVLYRKANGEPVVLSARCPHMGADLAIGEVLDDEIRPQIHRQCDPFIGKRHLPLTVEFQPAQMQLMAHRLLVRLLNQPRPHLPMHLNRRSIDLA